MNKKKPNRYRAGYLSREYASKFETLHDAKRFIESSADTKSTYAVWENGNLILLYQAGAWYVRHTPKLQMVDNHAKSIIVDTDNPAGFRSYLESKK